MGVFAPGIVLYQQKNKGWEITWWHYAQEAVLSDVLDDEVLRDLEQMEKESDLDDILNYQSSAEFEMQESLSRYSTHNHGRILPDITTDKPGSDEHNVKSRGWLNWLSRGMLGAGDTDDSSQLSGVVSFDVKDISDATEFHPLKYYIPSGRELSRLLGVCKAPVIQHLAETISEELKVQYDDLMDADDEGLLEEWLPASRVANPDKLGMRCYGRLIIRPRPPEFVKGFTFEVGAAVDAWCGDGWWESVIIAVDVSEVGTYQLYSPGEEKYMLAKKDAIRVAQDWIDDKWVDILGRPDICSIIGSNSGSQTKLSSNSAVVEGSMTGSSATLESPLPVAKVEVTPKVEQESSGIEPYLFGGMKRLTLWKPPLHAIHEDEDIDPFWL
ncbi:hypothetical protein KIW84_062834 [Lathyrus oleraceus]|uniref:Agenet domain-containing protein n=1 Tax=Pisum sativum TaxID=3888 RepID=A0A9D4W9U1_PEA|nr:hypothetical protein KIW84_062834 [Pisum sativum]